MSHCAQLSSGSSPVPPGARGGRHVPAARGHANSRTPQRCSRALRAGQVNAAWTTTAAPAIPADVVVLADRKPALIQAENVVPLYRRNELTERQVLAINEVAGVLDTAALADMRRQVAGGADPRRWPTRWLAEHPLGR